MYEEDSWDWQTTSRLTDRHCGLYGFYTSKKDLGLISILNSNSYIATISNNKYFSFIPISPTFLDFFSPISPIILESFPGGLEFLHPPPPPRGMDSELYSSLKNNWLHKWAQSADPNHFWGTAGTLRESIMHWPFTSGSSSSSFNKFNRT